MLTSSQRIFEDLLEAEELQDAQIDRGVKSEPAFVGAEGAVKLNAITTVHLALALVVFPDNSELDDPFRDGRDFKGVTVLGVFLEKGAIFEGGCQFLMGFGISKSPVEHICAKSYLVPL